MRNRIQGLPCVEKKGIARGGQMGIEGAQGAVAVASSLGVSENDRKKKWLSIWLISAK